MYDEITGLEVKSEHYFCSTFFFWATDKSALGAVQKMRAMYKNESKKTKRGAMYNLIRVPLDEDANYEISFFQPQVEGVELIVQERLFPELQK
jgi:hypothetical protein